MKYSIEDSTMTAIADALRAKTGTTAQLQPPDDYIAEIEKLHSDEWVLPDGWYDIESLPLTDDELCLYFLYDCTTNIRYAAFWTNYAFVTVSIAKVVNGVLTDWEELYSDTVGAHFIELPSDCQYVVIRLQAPTARNFVFANSSNYGLYSTTNNNRSNQPCLWYYGKIMPATSQSLYANQNGGIDTLMLKRVTLLLNDNVTLGYGFVTRSLSFLNINSITNNSASCYIYGSEKLNLDIEKIHSKNGAFPRISTHSIYVHNTECETGAISLLDRMRDNPFLNSMYMASDNIKITTMQRCFMSDTSVKDIIFDGFDFSECTSFSEAFSECCLLQNLKLGRGIKVNIALSSSLLLTKESILDLFENLEEVESKTITLGVANTKKLTAEEIAVATQKGWTVA